MPLKKRVKIRRKGKTVEIAWWVHDYNQRRKQERKEARRRSKTPTIGK